jgi:hypothetical protein
MKTVHRKDSYTTARDQLVAMIERKALAENLSFFRAAHALVRQPEVYDLLLRACGNWYKGKPPPTRVLSGWRNKHKVAVAKRWPDLTAEQLEYALPYLTPARRRATAPKPQASTSTRQQALELRAQGLPYKSISEITGVNLKTLYRWLPATGPGDPPDPPI